MCKHDMQECGDSVQIYCDSKLSVVTCDCSHSFVVLN
jgi:hypothetical protein